MGLTSGTALVLAVLLTALTVAGTLWVWPRLAARSWPAVFGRLGTVAVTQFVLLCTVALAVNDNFSFYSSWSDLFGSGASGPVTVSGGPGAGSSPGASPSPVAAGVQVLGTETFGTPGTSSRDPAQIGRLDRVRIPGGSTGLTSDGYVYLPPQYFQPAFQKKKFPAIVVMTGFPGDAKNLVTKFNYPGNELQLINQGKIRPLVQVLVRPSPTMPRDSECEDIPGGPQARTYFAKDVPADIQAAYRVAGSAVAGSAVAGGAHGWGVIGDSTGGYCALKLAMEVPDVYVTAVSLSGSLKAAEDVTTGDLFGGSQQRRNEADLNWRLANLPIPAVSVLLADSKDDAGGYAASTAFVAAVRPPMTAAQATVASGGHNFTTWVKFLPASFGWLSDHLADPS